MPACSCSPTPSPPTPRALPTSAGVQGLGFGYPSPPGTPSQFAPSASAKHRSSLDELDAEIARLGGPRASSSESDTAVEAEGLLSREEEKRRATSTLSMLRAAGWGDRSTAGASAWIPNSPALAQFFEEGPAMLLPQYNPPLGVDGGGPVKSKAPLPMPVLIVLWIILSSTCIILNKLILTGLDFAHPRFLITIHLGFTAIATRALHMFTHALRSLDLPSHEMSWDQWTQSVLPVGVLWSASLAAGNISYLSLAISFTQVVKAFTPLLVISVAFAVRLKEYQPRLFLAVIVIALSVAGASFTDIDFELTGFAWQVISVLCESARLVMIQMLLQQQGLEPLIGLYYVAPVTATINFVLLCITEGMAPFHALPSLGLSTLGMSALSALLLNFISFYVIGAASAIVLTLAGVVKDIALVAVALFMLGEPIKLQQIVGYSLAIGGLVLYKRWNSIGAGVHGRGRV